MGDVSTFDRFRRELEISRHLQHPGIQRSIEFTTDRSRPYMVMEYVDGETLRAFLAGGAKRLSVDNPLTVFGLVCDPSFHSHSVL